MFPAVAVGLDGSPESLAAVDWAAREALLRQAELRIVHAGDQPPSDQVSFTSSSAHMLLEVRTVLMDRHPDLRVAVHQVPGPSAAALSAAADEAGLLVLGTRGPGRAAGILLGSVARAVVARAGRPVVLVRADDGATDAHTDGPLGTPSGGSPNHDVVVGLDLRDVHDAVLGLAFDAASRRAAALRVVQGRNAPADPAAVAALRTWRERFPDVEVVEQSVIGTAGSHLADASRDASLVVVGRRSRPASVGPHIGPVTHAVLRHAVAPVVVVPHD
ncbi:MAG: universal stress protein [Streptomyces sp.]|jgi:nucleotide-binding universal stress UspA family protein|nr:universal stress protein [Streptomyces sp.]